MPVMCSIESITPDTRSWISDGTVTRVSDQAQQTTLQNLWLSPVGFDQNSEQALMVEAASIGANGFRFGNQLPAFDRPDEIMEGPIEIDVVDHQSAARTQRAPCMAHFEK